MRNRGHFSRRGWAVYAVVVGVAIAVAVVVGETLK
jgi:hypothetical protein